MIRINLLPVRASKKRELGKQWLVLFALVFVASAVGNYFWWSSAESTLAVIKSRIVKYEQELATVNKIIGEVNKFKDEKAEMEKKLDVLRKLREGRTGPVRVMDELASMLPAKVTLSSFEETAGRVTLTGYGVSLDEVANFLKKLKTSKFFSEPSLTNSKLSGENRVDFLITCQVKYST